MITFKPFRAFRPPPELASQVAAQPYDVLSTEEARQEANEYSLLHITRPEIDLPEGSSLYSALAYNKAAENFQKFKDNGWLVQDDNPAFYIYSQEQNGHIQYGLVGCCSIDDYFSAAIKKHELTRVDKENDRMKHVLTTDANMEPVFFAYKAQREMDQLVAEESARPAIYDFVATDGVKHCLWVISEPNKIATIEKSFAQLPALYIADGHHRTAAAVRVGEHKRERSPNYTGKEAYNYFMAVCFPDNQLNIIDYNRLVLDLNGLETDQFLSRLRELFTVTSCGNEPARPSQKREFGMYLGNEWFRLNLRPDVTLGESPIEQLDTSILTRYVLKGILKITDLRTSDRIDFVGGMRGLGELSKRVNNGNASIAFALYPVSMQELMTIADKGQIMPPKTTWFEPKLRSGLVVHELKR